MGLSVLGVLRAGICQRPPLALVLERTVTTQALSATGAEPICHERCVSWELRLLGCCHVSSSHASRTPNRDSWFGHKVEYIFFYQSIIALHCIIVVLVSVLQQSESAMHIHIPLPLRPPSTWPPPHPCRSSQSSELGSLCFSRLPPAIRFTHGNVYVYTYGLPWWLRGQESLEMQETVWSAGDQPFPGLGRSPGEGNGYPLQYSCLENSMDGGNWWSTVHGDH